MREFPRLPSGSEVALDLETWDPLLTSHGGGWCFPNKGQVLGFALGWGDEGQEEGAFWRWDRNTKAWLDDTCRRTDLKFIFHNRIYDEGWMRREGIPLRSPGYDTGIAAPLLDEYRYSYKLDPLLKDYLGIDQGKRTDALDEWRKAFNKGKAKEEKIKSHKALMADLRVVPDDVLATYGTGDGLGTLKLWRKLYPLIQEQNLNRVFQLEHDLVPILIEMRWRGIPVDVDAAERASKEFAAEYRAIMRRIESLLGFGLDIWNNDSLVKAFDSRGLPYPRTKKTKKASFTKDSMEKVFETSQDEFVRLLQQARNIDKTRATFVDGYILDKVINGRVHTSYSPLRSDEGGTVTGRFSSTKPNTTNLPNPEKDFRMGKMVRGFFLPEPGQRWASIDYSQQEPRWMVHWAEDIKAQGAYLAGEAYRKNPDMDFHAFMAKLTGLPRKRAKNIFLGKAYGMGGAKYCHDVGLPTEWKEINGRLTEVAGEEGQAQLDQFAAAVPWVNELSRECERRARRRGYIKTYSGRRARFGENGKEAYGKDFFYKAMNRLIQGSAADQTKYAVVALWKEGEVPLVIPHDELGCSVEDYAHAKKIATIMETCVPMSVPSKTDIELGASWGECVKVEDEEALAA